MALLECTNIVRSFGSDAARLTVLKGVNLLLEKGESMTVLGTSGAGKSTLLHVIGGIDRPDEGKVLLDGLDFYAQKDSEMARLRCQKLGFVFQLYHLMAELTALENVLLPSRIAGASSSQARKRALELLEEVSLKDRSGHFPAQLSGGEQQRVAIARALINGPELLLADEPTGNLDRQNSEMVVELLRRLQKEQGFAMLFVTHNRELKGLDRTLVLRDGLLVPEEAGQNLAKDKA